MASRVQKIEVFKNNFASCSCFLSCIMKRVSGKLPPRKIVSKVMPVGFPLSETVVQRCSVKKVLLKIS